MKKRVVVAMSGGVDSSLAAAFLVREGFEVIGVTLKIWPKELCGADKSKGSCCSSYDIEDARRVANQLKIPFYVLDYEEEFKQEVIDYFVSKYAQGRTPNPCIVCNERIKFASLLERIREWDADFLSTGHYARIEKRDGIYFLKEARDPAKDQSYVLFGLTQEKLARLLFPVGGLSKPEVRDAAKELGLKVYNKPDSQEVCFIPDGDTKSFLKSRIGVRGRRGVIVDRDGNILGEHDGAFLFTIGQRRGLGVAYKEPLYVREIDVEGNRVVAGTKEELLSRELVAERVNWVHSGAGMGGDLEGRQVRFSGTRNSPSERISLGSDFCSPSVTEPCPQKSLNAPKISPAYLPQSGIRAKIRYNHPKAEVKIEDIAGGRVKVVFKEPQFAVTPGQAVVFYDGGVVLGGGWIV